MFFANVLNNALLFCYLCKLKIHKRIETKRLATKNISHEWCNLKNHCAHRHCSSVTINWRMLFKSNSRYSCWTKDITRFTIAFSSQIVNKFIINVVIEVRNLPQLNGCEMVSLAYQATATLGCLRILCTHSIWQKSHLMHDVVAMTNAVDLHMYIWISICMHAEFILRLVSSLTRTQDITHWNTYAEFGCFGFGCRRCRALSSLFDRM